MLILFSSLSRQPYQLYLQHIPQRIDALASMCVQNIAAGGHSSAVVVSTTSPDVLDDERLKFVFQRFCFSTNTPLIFVFSVLVATWNVNANAVAELGDWLGDTEMAQMPDVIVVGLQEIVI